jgi:hypothetical protein
LPPAGPEDRGRWIDAQRRDGGGARRAGCLRWGLVYMRGPLTSPRLAVSLTLKLPQRRLP